MRLHSKKGQGTAEYAVVFAVVLAFAIGMQTYVKRALNARLKAGVNKMVSTTNTKATGDLVGLKVDAQYEPYYVNQAYKTKRDDTYTETTDFGTISRVGFLNKTTRAADDGTTGFQEERGASALDSDNVWKDKGAN